MRGMTGAASDLTDTLRARVPAKVDELERRLGLDTAEQVTPGIPKPALYADHARPRLEAHEWPAVLAVAQGTAEAPVVLERGALEDLWRFVYRLRVYVYVRDDGFGAVDQTRKRLMLAMVETLIERPSVTGDGATVVRPGSLRESYSDVLPDDVGRSVGAAYLELDLEAEETVTPTVSAGTVATTEPTAEPMPTDPGA